MTSATSIGQKRLIAKLAWKLSQRGISSYYATFCTMISISTRFPSYSSLAQRRCPWIILTAGKRITIASKSYDYCEMLHGAIFFNKIPDSSTEFNLVNSWAKIQHVWSLCSLSTMALRKSSRSKSLLDFS